MSVNKLVIKGIDNHNLINRYTFLIHHPLVVQGCKVHHLLPCQFFHIFYLAVLEGDDEPAAISQCSRQASCQLASRN